MVKGNARSRDVKTHGLSHEVYITFLGFQSNQLQQNIQMLIVD